jgi:cytochrome c oxidase assembly factor CtaG
VWSAWTLRPYEIAPAAIACALYASGLHASGIRAVSRARAASFAAGAAVALLAVVSPLHAFADETFSGHMAQHLILMFVAAPLIVAGRPGLVMALALPLGVRKWGWSAARRTAVAATLRQLRRPSTIFVTYTAALWLWHLPGLYDAAVRHPGVHAAQHASFLGVALAFWAAVVRTGPRRRLAHAPAMALVIATMLQSTWLSAILTFGNETYRLYAQRAPIWGINAGQDQQLAGTLMWIPSEIVFFAVFGVLFVRWLRDLDLRHPKFPVEQP